MPISFKLIVEMEGGIRNKWEISIMEVGEGKNKSYKITRRMPDMLVAETKIFNSKEEAKKQFNEWLE